MECLPLDFQRRQPIKATDDSRWCAVRSFDSFRRFESDIFIPFPRIWGLFACFNAMPHATARAFNPVSIHSCILTGNETNIIKALQNTHKWQPAKVARHRIHFQLMTAVTTFWNPVIKINSYIFWLHLSNQSKDITSVLQHALTDKQHQIKRVSWLLVKQQDMYLAF